ncbi:MAG: tetraacyldisaccharide 4'-kinase [Pseudomonadota bacterium]|nr:tetraacyldisaccharide 4'-kinase [Pseudomonadota bacterium]
MIHAIWKTKNLISSLLKPFSLIYYLFFLFYKSLRSENICKIPIVCVGNVTVGGSGKTPVVIKLRKVLKRHFTKIFVLTRGYKGKKKGPIIVNNKLTFLEVGDESILHSKHGLTCMAKNKVEGARLCEANDSELIIMDDGLQSIDIKKDIKILVIDGDYCFGNERILPAGPLREPAKKAIKASDLILIIGNKKKIDKYKMIPTNKVFYAKKIIKTTHLKGKKLYVFSALGNNENFHNSLNEKGLKISKYKEFPDHHLFKESEIKEIIIEAKEKNFFIVCTFKDHLKLPEKYKKYIYPVELDLKVEEQKKFISKILNSIKLRKVQN